MEEFGVDAEIVRKFGVCLEPNLLPSATHRVTGILESQRRICSNVGFKRKVGVSVDRKYLLVKCWEPEMGFAVFVRSFEVCLDPNLCTIICVDCRVQIR